MTRYVVGFLFDEKCKQVVLIHKHKPDWQRDRLNGLGGHIEAGESPEEAMTREFMEEAGVHIMPWTRVARLHCAVYELHVFAARSEKLWEVTTNSNEGIVAIYAVSELVRPGSLILDNLAYLLPFARLAVTPGSDEYFATIEVHNP